MTLQLKAGPHDLLGRETPAGELYQLDALVADATFGEAEAVVRSVTTQLLDGDVTRNGRKGNRTAVIRVRVKGPNAQALGRGGAALDLWAANPTTLAFTPPGHLGVMTIFRVVRAVLTWEFNLRSEAEATPSRIYKLTMECKPFGLAETAVRDAALVLGAGADEQINAADSLSGWTGREGTVLALDTGSKAQGTASIRLTPPSSAFDPVDGGMSSRVTLVGEAELATSAATMSNRPYVSVSVYIGDSVQVDAQLWVNGAEARVISSRPIPNVIGWARYVFRTDVTGTATSLRFLVTQVGIWPGNAETAVLPASWMPHIDDVRRSGTVPGGTTRQAIREVPVRGTARTEGSVQVSHPSDALGTVLVYSHPALGPGYVPALSPWFTSLTGWAADVDAASISGVSFQPVDTAPLPITFEIPLAQLPRGAYQLLAHGTYALSLPVGHNIVVTVSTKLGGVVIGSRTYRKALPPQTGAGTAEGFLPAAVPIVLPEVDVPLGSPATAVISWRLQDPAGVFYRAALNEVFLLAMSDDASLVIVDAGTRRRLWIDSATIETPTPTVWIGNAEDRSDSFYAGGLARSFDALSLVPPAALLFVANDGAATLPAVTLDHVPAFGDLAYDTEAP